jgi:putative DNA methylase
MNSFGDLFSSRQLASLNTVADLVEAARHQILDDMNRYASAAECSEQYSAAIATYLAFAVDKAADLLDDSLLLAQWGGSSEDCQYLWTSSDSNVLGLGGS